MAFTFKTIEFRVNWYHMYHTKCSLLLKKYCSEFSQKTEKKLPSGEDIDVSKGYSALLKYYTGSNTTAEGASKLGYKLVDKFYKQVMS